MIESLNALFQRDIRRVVRELQAFEKEEDLWSLPCEVTNSAGTLGLHLAGNLRHFIGAVLGNSGYDRNRHAEFSTKDIPVEEIITQLELAASDVRNVLDSITEDQLRETYPLEVFGEPMTTIFFLVHLQGHLNYHLGQISYLRKVLT